jgi:hypothetical protein
LDKRIESIVTLYCVASAEQVALAVLGNVMLRPRMAQSEDGEVVLFVPVVMLEGFTIGGFDAEGGDETLNELKALPHCCTALDKTSARGMK